MSNRLRGRFPNRSSNRVPSWVLTAGGVPASLDIDFVNDRAYSASPSSIPILLSCTRASSGYCTNADGTLTLFSDNQLRYGSSGLLTEEQRTNLVIYSAAFDTPTSGANWVKTRASITPNAATAPDGTVTADFLYEDNTSSSTHTLYQSFTVTNGVTYTISIYIKYVSRRWVRVLNGSTVTGSAWFDVQNGVIGTVSGTGSPSAKMEALGNGWYRCCVTVTAGSTFYNCQVQLADADASNTYNGDGTSGVYIWGAQVEAGDAATSYIPTTTVSVQRKSDAVNFNSISWFNESAGTLYAASTENYIGSAGTYRIWDVSANNSSYGHTISHFNGVPFYGINNNTTQASIGIGTISAGSTSKWAAAYATNDAALSLNGSAVSTDASVTLPTGMLSSYVGSIVGTVVGSRYVRRLAYWPTRVSNANLVTLAT